MEIRQSSINQQPIEESGIARINLNDENVNYTLVGNEMYDRMVSRSKDPNSKCFVEVIADSGMPYISEKNGEECELVVQKNEKLIGIIFDPNIAKVEGERKYALDELVKSCLLNKINGKRV